MDVPGELDGLLHTSFVVTLTSKREHSWLGKEAVSCLFMCLSNATAEIGQLQQKQSKVMSQKVI